MTAQAISLVDGLGRQIFCARTLEPARPSPRPPEAAPGALLTGADLVGKPRVHGRLSAASHVAANTPDTTLDPCRMPARTVAPGRSVTPGWTEIKWT